MEKAAITYRPNFSIAKESGGWGGAERLGHDASIMIGDAKQTSTSPVTDE